MLLKPCSAVCRCSNACVKDHSLECEYSAPRPRRQHQRPNELRTLQHRLSRIESMLPDNSSNVQQSKSSNEELANSLGNSTNRTALIQGPPIEIVQHVPSNYSHLPSSALDTRRSTSGPESHVLPKATHSASLSDLHQSSFAPDHACCSESIGAAAPDRVPAEPKCFTVGSTLTPPHTIISPGSVDDDGSCTYPPEDEVSLPMLRVFHSRILISNRQLLNIMV